MRVVYVRPAALRPTKAAVVLLAHAFRPLLRGKVQMQRDAVAPVRMQAGGRRRRRGGGNKVGAECIAQRGTVCCFGEIGGDGGLCRFVFIITVGEGEAERYFI